MSQTFLDIPRIFDDFGVFADIASALIKPQHARPFVLDAARAMGHFIMPFSQHSPVSARACAHERFYGPSALGSRPERVERLFWRRRLCAFLTRHYHYHVIRSIAGADISTQRLAPPLLASARRCTGDYSPDFSYHQGLYARAHFVTISRPPLPRNEYHYCDSILFQVCLKATLFRCSSAA